MVEDPLVVVVAWWFIGDPLALLLPLLLISCSSIGMDHLLAMDFARLHGGVSIFPRRKTRVQLDRHEVDDFQKPRESADEFAR